MLLRMVQSPWAASLGWTLLHSLWEGALVAVALGAVLCLTRSPRIRYAAAGAALLALAAMLAVTFARCLPETRGLQAALERSAGPLRLPAVPPDSGNPELPFLPRCLPWLAPLWMAGVLAFQLRSLAAWMAARRLRRAGVCAAPAPWRARLDELARSLAVSRPVLLLESGIAEVPVVMGYLRPAILIPAGLLAGLPAAQVEAILLHELAHIRRHDYLVNLLQTVMEGLLFYHPAVWWISWVMRAEREHCCDDLAVAAQGDAFGYVSALAALEERRAVDAQVLLASNGGSLVKRIRRLLAPPEGPRAGFAPLLSVVVLMLALAGVTAAWQSRPPATPPAIDQAPAEVQTPYTKWLHGDVAYIITGAERAAFQGLRTDAEREQFIEQFWKRRDPTPDTVENEFKEEHYRRIAYANQFFGSDIPGWKTDRGRIYIVYGPPDEIESHPHGFNSGADPGVPYEQWRYRLIEGIGHKIIVEFTDHQRNGEYRMTSDPNGVATLGARSAGAAVEAVGHNGVRLFLYLGRYGGDPVNIYGRITTANLEPVDTFEETRTGQLTFSRFLALKPGSYRLEFTVKDITTGASNSDSLAFLVR